MLDAIFDAVLLVDGDGAVAEANARAAELFGAVSEGLEGRGAASLFDIDAGELRRRMAAVLVGGGFSTIESRCVRLDGSLFQGELSIGRMEAARQGSAPGICLTVRDVSVRHKAQQDLKHALERMEALGRARMEFVSNASHELRTPLTSMIYAVRNLQGGHAGPLGERAMQYLSRLEADCHRLLGTVNDILDLRQIENNTLTLVRRLIAPVPVARDAADSLRGQAAAKGVSLSFEEAPRIDFCLGDPAKLERVFINVIGNAVKFTPAGGAISVTAGRDDAFHGMTVVKVADTGVGIPPEALPKVTARFFQVGDQPVGTGLGLAITKELLELHGGRLRVESPNPGTDCGTCVTVALPLAGEPRILVVAATGSPAAKAVEGALAARCVKAVRISGGHAAFRDCLERAPDVVALCGDTDDLPAAEFVMRTRNDRRLRGMPIVFLQDGSPAADAAAHLMEAFKVKVVATTAPGREAVTAILKAMRG